MVGSYRGCHNYLFYWRSRSNLGSCLLICSWCLFSSGSGACPSPGHDCCGYSAGWMLLQGPFLEFATLLKSYEKDCLMMSISLRKLLVFHHWVLKRFNLLVTFIHKDLLCLVSHSPDLGHPGSERSLSLCPTPALGCFPTACLDSPFLLRPSSCSYSPYLPTYFPLLIHYSSEFWLKHTGSVNLRFAASPAARLPTSSSALLLHREDGETTLHSSASTVPSSGFLK